jgi:hypothetical protein
LTYEDSQSGTKVRKTCSCTLIDACPLNSLRMFES